MSDSDRSMHAILHRALETAPPDSVIRPIAALLLEGWEDRGQELVHPLGCSVAIAVLREPGGLQLARLALQQCKREHQRLIRRLPVKVLR